MGPGDAFYGIIPNNFATKLGVILGNYQNVTWGTGTHTATPVGLFTYGPKYWTDKYEGALHSTEVGQLNLEVLGLSKSKEKFGPEMTGH